MKRLVFALVVLAAGCGGMEQEASIGWTFGAANAGCDEAGVQTVHVFLGPLGASGFYDQEVRCETGVAPALLRMRGVAPGTHTLVIKGLARDKTLFYLERQVEVPAGDGARLGRFQVPEYVEP